jgi:cation diffusion facilitator family transporter
VPLAIAFVLRSRRGERWSGYAIVSVVLASAVLAGVEAFRRLVHPPSLHYLAALAAAGAIGFAGNELAARIRLRAGERLGSSALVADGHHARVDGYVSLGVIVSAGAAAVGLDRIDPIVGLVICAVILRVTWQALRTVKDA